MNTIKPGAPPPSPKRKYIKIIKKIIITTNCSYGWELGWISALKKISGDIGLEPTPYQVVLDMVSETIETIEFLGKNPMMHCFPYHTWDFFELSKNELIGWPPVLLLIGTTLPSALHFLGSSALDPQVYKSIRWATFGKIRPSHTRQPWTVTWSISHLEALFYLIL